MSVTNQSTEDSKKTSQDSKNVTLSDALSEDNKEIEFLKTSIIDLTRQLIATRDQLRELTGEKTSESKSSLAIEYYNNNPGLKRPEYLAAFIELGFGKAYAATMYQKIKKLNGKVKT